MKFIRGFLSLVMASSLILSSIGLSVSRHYCLGMLAEESFFHLGDETCGMENHESTGCNDDYSFTGFDCCADENLSIPGIQIQDRDPSDVSKKLIEKTSFTSFDSLDALKTVVFDNSSIELANGPPDPGSKAVQNILITQQRFLI